MQYTLSEEAQNEFYRLIILQRKLPYVVLNLSKFINKSKNEKTAKVLSEDLLTFFKREKLLSDLYFGSPSGFAITEKLFLKAGLVFKKHIDKEKYDKAAKEITKLNQIVELINSHMIFLKKVPNELLKTKFKMPTELFNYFEPEFVESIHNCMINAEIERRTMQGKAKRRFYEKKEYGMLYLGNIQNEILGEENIFAFCQHLPFMQEVK